MAIRVFILSFLCACAGLSQNGDPDAVTKLAAILAAKGTITRSELNEVKSVSAYQDRLAKLAALLKAKGVLDAQEMAQLSLPGPPATRAPPSAVAQERPPAVSAEPNPSGAPEVSPPVVTQTRVPVTIYGTLLFNSFYNTAGTNIEDVPTFTNKQGSDPTGGDKNFGMTARQTRIGLRYKGPDVGGASVSGNFEFDLFGGKTPLPNGIDMDMFRLRLAYGRVDWRNFAIEAGQDWSVFAPLNPTSYASYSIPEFAAAGNPWIRLPQLRLEIKNTISETNRLLWQFAALDPDMGDYQTSSFSTSRVPAIGERGRMPSLESRVTWTHLYDGREYAIGLSGHYGRGKNAGTIGTLNVQQPVDSWGVALDYSLPINRVFALTGEAYGGRALGIYSVALGESIGAVGTAGAHGVESRGGWMQGQFTFTKQWQLNLGYGIDAPNVSQLPVGNRSRNQMYMGNIVYKWRPSMTFAWEYRRLVTDFRNQIFENERGDHADLSVAYSF